MWLESKINGFIVINIHCRIVKARNDGQNLEILIEPGSRLRKSSLLGKANCWFGDVCTDSETMLNATEQVDLIWLASFDEDFLGFMTL